MGRRNGPEKHPPRDSAPRDRDEGSQGPEGQGASRPGGHEDAPEARIHPQAPPGLKEPALSFPVVAIGCSAGGLDPLRRLLSGFERDCGMAFVAIQHLEPSHESHMTELLSRATSLPVETIHDGVAVAPGRVYVLPPNRYVVLRAHDLHTEAPQLSRGRRMPIDHFLRSLAEVQQERGICVLLSGAGDDGAAGARAMREHGGLVIVQDPQESDYADMPRATVATGMVDYILPVDRMPEVILRYAQRSHLRSPKLPLIRENTKDDILDQVLGRTGHDFRGYKNSTLVRRIHRRMGLNQVDSPELYLELLRMDAREAARLRDDLLIGVTAFFREPESWDELRRLAAHDLIAELPSDSTLRAWVPGCSTGEEAYSLAILMLEEMEAQRRRVPLQIFASDIDEAALEVARHGLYDEGALAELPRQYRERFFQREGRQYRCERIVREPVIFSRQNLISDPPFSRLDLVSCRNLLIYLESEMQVRAAMALAFSLRAGGWLFLGKSDSIPDPEHHFRLVSKPHRIYVRLDTKRPEFSPGPPAGRQRVQTSSAAGRRTSASPADLAAVSQQLTLKHFGACTLLVDTRGKILHVSGDATRYLTLPPGQPDLDLVGMAREKLSLKLRTALGRLSPERMVMRIDRVEIDANGRSFKARATLRLLPATNRQAQVIAVILEEVHEPAPAPSTDLAGDEDSVRSLEDEIRSLKDELQNTYQEFELSNQELKAANEEVMSMNEELQSANEELETSKEEMQSINEELTTVNSQLNEKVLALGSANDDLANLFNATKVAIIFLDEQFRIRRFTPHATELLNLIDSDIGRPLAHISQNFDSARAIEQARRVLSKLIPIEEEIATPEGRWFTMRLFPYRTVDNHIAGVVITFNDVTRLKQVEAYAGTLMGLVHEPLLVLDRGYRIVAANPAFRKEFGLGSAEVPGRRLTELEGQHFALIQANVESILHTDGPRTFEIAYESQGGGSGRCEIELKPLEGPALLLTFRRQP